MEHGNTFKELLQKLEDKTAIVCVMGMGYVGLPLALEFCRAGYFVYGYDVNEARVERLKKGNSYVDDVKNEDLIPHIDSGRLLPTADPSVLARCDCIAIAVPTPLNKTKDPDISYILDACEKIKKHLHRGTLVVLESTTYPGTTEEVVLPILESTGFKVGVDFFLAFSPERVDPGNPVYNVHNTPKIIGGITQACTQLASAFYLGAVERIHPVSSAKTAEMVKLLENTFREINIGMVNEMAIMCDLLKVDIWEIIEAAKTKPFGFMPFYPGPGLGGHCIPIDPHYLSWKLKTVNYYARFIELAGDINSNMPRYVVRKTMEFLNEVKKPLKDSNVVLLGVAYKRDVSDVRESPALDVLELLEEKGAKVVYNDPYVPEIKWKDGVMRSVELTEELLENADIVLILTDHRVYDYGWIVEHSQLIFDTRNATSGYRSPRIKRLGAA
jgi:UDP-N-acetyl-D-glucosamine dehydrogenase